MLHIHSNNLLGAIQLDLAFLLYTQNPSGATYEVKMKGKQEYQEVSPFAHAGDLQLAIDGCDYDDNPRHTCSLQRYGAVEGGREAAKRSTNEA